MIMNQDRTKDTITYRSTILDQILTQECNLIQILCTVGFRKRKENTAKATIATIFEKFTLRKGINLIKNQSLSIDCL